MTREINRACKHETSGGTKGAPPLSLQLKTIKVLFEDPYYIAFDKPAGLLVISAPGRKERTLSEIVNNELKKKSACFRMHPCHRIDRETSGLILFAKGKKSQQIMMERFRKKNVSKYYIALVQGHMKQKQGVLKSKIRNLERGRFYSDAPFKMAVTRYNVDKEMKDYSIVSVWPKTGRTNQIRIQFAERGHPLLGERKYARSKDRIIKFRRCALHARQLIFRHPVLKTTINISCDLAQDMSHFIEGH